MPGTFIFRPIEANLNSEAAVGSYRRSLDPLCKVQIGHRKLCTLPSKCFGPYPEWDETLIAQEGEETTCTVSLEDNNRMNPNRALGEFELNLDDVYDQGRVTKWFDIRKKNRVQGHLLMEVTYTEANPDSRVFHQSFLPGAAVACTNKPFDYYVHHAGKATISARKEVQEELEHVHEHGLTPPSSEISKTLNQLHLNKKDPGDTGISNPKTKINHPNAENDPSLRNTRNKETTPKKPLMKNPAPYLKKPGQMSQKDKKEIQKHLGTAPPSRVSQWEDPTLNQLHLEKGNLADTGMSNPNTMELGVNHREHDPVFHIKDRELARHPNESLNYYDIYSADTGMSNPNFAGLGKENLRDLGVTAMVLSQDRRLPHFSGQYNGPYEIDKRTTAYDTNLGGFSHPRESWSCSGISDPNTITEGINHQPGHVGWNPRMG